MHDQFPARIALHHIITFWIALAAVPDRVDASATRPLSDPFSWEVEARLSPSGDTVRATARGMAPVRDGRIHLSLYPNRLGDGSRLPKPEVHWRYPWGPSPAMLHIAALRIDGRTVSARRAVYDPETHVLSLPARTTAAAVEVHIAFDVRVPRRTGRFGRTRGATVLGGGWFPRPVVPDAKRRWVLVTVSAAVTVHAPAHWGVLVADRWFDAAPSPQRHTAVVPWGRSIPLVFVRGATARRIPAGPAAVLWIDGRGAATMDDRLRRNTAPERRADPLRTAVPPPQAHRDTARRAAVWMGRVFARARRAHIPVPSRFPVVVVPAEDHLVFPFANALLVSDALFDVVHLAAIQEFHIRELVRGTAAALAAPAVAAKEPDAVVEQAAAALGHYLFAAVMTDRDQTHRRLDEVLRALAFLPYVDNLIYDPHMPFAADFAPPSSRTADRDEPWVFADNLPTGTQLASKLILTLGAPTATRILSRYAQSTAPLRTVIASAWGERPSFRRWWEAWTTPLPARDLGVKKVVSRPDGSGFVHRVVLRHRGRRIPDAVTVRLEDRDGRMHDALWRPEHGDVVTWRSAAPLRQVVVDPGHTVRETAVWRRDHPRGDNLWKRAWRPPLLSRFLVWWGAGQWRPFVDATVGMRPLYDNRLALFADAAYSPRKIGGGVSAYHYTGSPLNDNALSAYMGTGVSVYHHDATDAPASLPARLRFAGTAFSWKAAVGSDTRRYFLDPLRGRAWRAQGTVGAVHADNGTNRPWGAMNVRYFWVHTAAIRHTLAVYGGAMATVGTLPATALSTLSDRNRLRGYGLYTTTGHLGAYQVVEWRETLPGRLPIHLPGHTRLDRLQLVAFGAIGIMDAPGRMGHLDRTRVFPEVGMGLRLFWFLFGAAPYLVAVDAAVPVGPQWGLPVRWTVGITQTY